MTEATKERIRRDPPKLQNVREVAVYLDDSVRSLRRRIAQGQIPTIRLSARKLLVRTAALDRVLHELERPRVATGSGTTKKQGRIAS